MPFCLAQHFLISAWFPNYENRSPKNHQEPQEHPPSHTFPDMHIKQRRDPLNPGPSFRPKRNCRKGHSSGRGMLLGALQGQSPVVSPKRPVGVSLLANQLPRQPMALPSSQFNGLVHNQTRDIHWKACQTCCHRLRPRLHHFRIALFHRSVDRDDKSHVVRLVSN